MWHLRPADDQLVRQIAAQLELPAPVARVLVARGFGSAGDVRDFLALRDGLKSLKWPSEAPGIQKAVARIRQAVDAGERIGLYGDYDCDGVTSAAILYRYLSRGLKADIHPRLPDRFKDGYGVHPQAVDQLHAQGCKVVLTCDNGISAHGAAARAKELGMDMIVTDHHTVGSTLPAAYALVHPQIEFPEFKDLCGAGVAFLLCIALEGGLSERLESFLDLVAMGTIADVVPLSGVNRTIVWAGLDRMRRDAVHPGTRALAEVAGVNLAKAGARDLGFSLCPRLNAAGRLETPDIGFQLLVTNDRNAAKSLAEKLDGVNQDRRTLNADLEAQVLAMVEAEVDVERQPFIVLGREDFHHGIVGIVAGRVAERYRTPVLLLSPNDDGTWRGSGRSPSGFHLYEALAACSHLLVGFGGHAQAAGCRVAGDQLAPLMEALNQHVVNIGWSRPKDEKWLDAALPFDLADGDLLSALERLEPFGHKHEAPVFGLLDAHVAGVRVKGGHVFMMVDDGDRTEEVIAWGQAERAPAAGDRLNVAYLPKWNTFRGETRIQRIASAFESMTPAAAVRQASDAARREADVRLTDVQLSHVRLTDLRRKAWKGIAPNLDAQKVGIYSEDEHAVGVWLRPEQAVPEGLEQIVCLDVPTEARQWRNLTSAAPVVILAWEGIRGAELSPETLQAVYQHLFGRRGVELFTAIEKAPVPLAEAQAAVQILREGGLLSNASGGWRLLEAPDGPIGLTKLAAYQNYRQARAFREKLDRASVEEARQLAGLPAAQPAEPVTV
jgi:single-stranded-DNA-specific exonuclease